MGERPLMQPAATTASQETAAVLALVVAARRPWSRYRARLHAGHLPTALLYDEFGLLAESELTDARRRIEEWRTAGIHAVSSWDTGYPAALRAVAAAPPLLFIRGDSELLSRPGVSVVGSRRASPQGLLLAAAIAHHLSDGEWAVVSGLAAGIDTAAHVAALACGGATVAVIGTGVERCYPAENAPLQREIARTGAVVSQFLPDAAADRAAFPKRNALMAALTRATVIVEASHTSGTRIAARVALACGRTVLLQESLLEQGWAGELLERDGVHVFATADDVRDLLAAGGSPLRPGSR